MVLDGYTWVANIVGVRVLYRPALRDERTQLFELFGTNADSWENWVETRLEQAGTPQQAIGALLGRFHEHQQQIVGVLLGTLDPSSESPWGSNWERASAENLLAGVRLLRDFPGIAKRSCDDCREWWYREDGSVVLRADKSPVPRPAADILPCRTKSGCPKGTPESPRTLWPSNRMALSHFRQCDATGRFPDDPLVGRNAAIIRSVLSEKPK